MPENFLLQCAKQCGFLHRSTPLELDMAEATGRQFTLLGEHFVRSVNHFLVSGDQRQEHYKQSHRKKFGHCQSDPQNRPARPRAGNEETEGKARYPCNPPQRATGCQMCDDIAADHSARSFAKNRKVQEGDGAE